MGEAPDQLKPDRLILVGRVAGAFGVKGELRLTAYTADPLALFAYRTLLDRSGQPKLTLVSARAAKGDVICRTQEPFTKEEADALRGTQLFVPRSALPPPEEEEKTVEWPPQTPANVLIRATGITETKGYLLH